ncbi:MAG: hypothetical protein ABUL77_02155 [Bacteroidota bacterium]
MITAGANGEGSDDLLPAEVAAVAGSRLDQLLGTRKGLAVLFLAFASAYLGASGGRLRQHSAYNHYVYLAEGWLHGRLSLAGPPPNENDWAKVDLLHLRDGRTVRGSLGGRGGPADRFYPLRGRPETIAAADIVSRSSTRYVSFPPLPAVAMLPFVAIWGLAFNDVLFTALWAAVNPVLLFLLLRSLSRHGLSRRAATDDLWLTILFGVGSVYYFCSVVGQVWFTAHVVAVTTVIGFAWAAVDARRPAWAGLFVGLGLATRPPGLGLMAVLFLWESVRTSDALVLLDGKRRFRPTRALAGKLVRFGVPCAAVLVVLFVHNWARFANPFEFGHRFLNVQWQERIQRFGLFNYHFLSRNLAAALILLPRVLTKWPYVKISQHGMSLLLTSPPLAYTVLPAERSRLAWPLWLTVLATALPSLLYQNSGYIQLGYRFSLDYMVFLVMILAVGNRPLSRLWKGLTVASVAVNLLLAIVFDRFADFTYDDSFFPHGFN